MTKHSIPVGGLALIAGALVAGGAVKASQNTSQPTPTVTTTDPCRANAWPPPSECIVPGWKVVGPDGTVYVHRSVP